MPKTDAGRIYAMLQVHIESAREEMADCRDAGINSPAFNQAMGGLDVLNYFQEWFDQEFPAAVLDAQEG